MKKSLLLLIAFTFLFSACQKVDLNLPVPVFETEVDPDAWATIPAGEFQQGQFDDFVSIEYSYEIMITDVTVAQYVDFLNTALADGSVKIAENKIIGNYPGDIFHGAKHEIRIEAGDYLLVPLEDHASPFTFDGKLFASKNGWENHPMTNVSWFGAWTYCGFYSWRLPTELEWEKAGRGSDDNRPFPWGERINKNNANYYKSGDPFEEMSTVGSRTSPVGFYNGQTYDGYATVDSVSPYGLYDMAGNVWQWLGDITPGLSDRILRGGSRNSYPPDLRIWARNSAVPMHYSTEIGFRCARDQK